MTAPQTWIDDAIILKSEVGSVAHGINIEGKDDTDHMAICIEPVELAVGLQRFEHYIYRTAEERVRHDPEADQRRAGQQPKSQAGDLDLVVYSLRKYCGLAAAGNPSILVLLFAQPLTCTSLGRDLLYHRDMFASREAGKRFLGYLKAQKERLLGVRGQMRVTRTDLIEKHGYDTKYASHAIRLGIQGVEYLSRGFINVPMLGPDQTFCRRVREGQVPFAEAIQNIETFERVLLKLVSLDSTSPLPHRPNYKAIDEFLVDAYLTTWNKARWG